MSIKHDAFILILSSPSGAGKTTLTKALLEVDKNIEMSVSCTTRPKRENEIEGKDYFFVDEEKFQNLIIEGELLEHAYVYENSYGTPKKRVEELLEEGKDVIFDIDWQGTNQLKTRIPDNIVSVFILPPSIKELESRLMKRNTEDKEIIKMRLSRAKIEISHWDSYDYVIVNKNIDQSLDLIKSILNVERLKRANIWKIADELLKTTIMD